MHIAPLIRDLAVILAVAGAVTLLFQRLRQPVVLGYLVAGMLVSRFGAPADLPSVQTWGQLGVIFLMFSLGLEFSFRKLARVGVSAALTAIFEVTFMGLLGYGAGRLMGWRVSQSIFLGALVSISSTTVIVRALEEMNLKTRRFAEMIFAVLIVEDLIAILILVALSTVSSTQSLSGFSLLASAGKLILVVAAWFVSGYFVVPRFVRYVGRVGSNEMLTLVSLALCLGLVLFSAYFDYSFALGAFIMGSILAESTESFRIEERIGPLRDLFAAVFFVSIGMMIDLKLVWEFKGTVLALAGLVIGGKIVGATLGALLTGQTLRTSIQVGFGLAQIGEFSFIIAGLGLALGTTHQFLYPVAVAISLLTTFTTPYLIRVSHRFSVWLEDRLPLPVRHLLMQYVTWSRERAADTTARKTFYRLFFKWSVNGVIATSLFIIVAERVGPWLLRQLGQSGGVSSSPWPWLLALTLSSPFLWAMLAAFRTFRFRPDVENVDHPPPGGTLLAMRFLTLAWISVLSIPFVSFGVALLLLVGFSLLLFFLFRRQLEGSYQWFEHRFLSTFDRVQKTPSRRDLVRHLAPWDAHLVRVKVHPNADIVMKTIAQSRLRQKAGINVVVIQRGLKSIIAPRADELILPKDELLVLGNDEQIETVRGTIERPPGLQDRFASTQHFEQQELRLGPLSELVGKTIRDSGIRENYNAMVVGLERDARRTLNPHSELILQVGDILWLVGEKSELQKLASAMAPGPA